MAGGGSGASFSLHIERGGEEHNGRGRREATEKGGRDGGRENILHQAIIICRLGRRGRGGEGRWAGGEWKEKFDLFGDATGRREVKTSHSCCSGP